MKGHALTTQPPNHQTKANTARGKNGIIHAMKPHAKSALSLALAIVGGMAAGMRCDASVTVENSSQINPRVAAYTVKTYTEGSPTLLSKEIFMAIAEDIGFDATGKPTKVNELDEIGVALADFIQKEAAK